MRPILFLAAAALLLSALLPSAGPRAEEAREVRIAVQYGLAYLPLAVMQRQRLLEQEAVRAGLPEPAVTWSVFGNGAAMNDGLLSNSLDVVASGTPVVVTIWDRTRANLRVRALSSVSGLPYRLVTRNPAVRTLRDLSEGDRIALPAVKVSFQAVILQMAAEREWGAGAHGRLDPLTVSLSHPDALIALRSGRSEVTTHFATPPFQEIELQDPALHSVLSSFDGLGPHSALLAYATTRFHDANPRTTAAFLAALARAAAFIRARPREAAELYLASERSPAPVEMIEAILRDPQARFSPVPEGIEPFIAFQHRIGAIRQVPETWRDLFFPEVFALPER